MSLTVNGQATAIPVPRTLETLMAALHPQRPYAVALNEEFVPASAYQICELSDGDRIEIVHPSAGG